MVFEGVKFYSCSVGGKWLYVVLPKIGMIKVRHHRPIADGAVPKQAQVIKKADGWYINLRLQDNTCGQVLCVPNFKLDIIPSWDNSLGMDAVLHEDDYLATSEGTKLPSLKSFRKSQNKLAKISTRKNARNKGSKSRRKLAKKEARLHQKSRGAIRQRSCRQPPGCARARRDHAYHTAHQLLKTGKKVFFYEKLNLQGLSRKNKPKQDEAGKYLPNGQSSKSGLNKSWSDAAFGQFFTILDYMAGKAGAVTKAVNPAYTSQLLSYKDKFVFVDVGIRMYWDKNLQLEVDHDINSGINIKRVGLDVDATIKRRKGNPVVVASTTNSTSKEVLSVLMDLEKPTLYSIESV